MALRFEFVRDPTLPVGAWCLRVVARSETVAVRLGATVETFDDRFFSGVWTGSFADAECTHADARLGSGATVQDGRLELLTPTHPYSGVYVTRVSDRLFASNSLLCLLAETKAVPAWGNTRYFNLLSRQNRYPDVEHEFDFMGTVIRALRLDRFAVDDSLDVRRVTIPSAVHFTDFESFRTRVTAVLAGLGENATSATRLQPLSLKATISAGYDSTGAAALGYDAGWRDAVAIVRTDSGADDNGLAVAEHLGYRVESLPADAWTTKGPCPEAEFLAAAGPITRVRLSGATTLGHSVMLTGTMGDMTWAPGTPLLKHRFRRPFDYPGAEDGLNEWALRLGSVFLPVPSLGADDRAQMRRVTDAPELEPWKLGIGYDRPLPRRLVEERGVPRDAFGQRKMASAQLSATVHLGEASRADFRAWWHQQDDARATWRHRTGRFSARFALRGAHRLCTEKFAEDVRNWHTVSHPTWTNAHLFHWAVERTRVRYGEPFFDG